MRHQAPIHNPFPQLKRVAVLPFNNQSTEPTLDAAGVTEGYYAALQAIPGFEVLPVGVTEIQLLGYSQVHGVPQSGQDFQALARYLDVDAVVLGAVTDYTPYYPPRLAMTVRWYAANPSFHPIPPGYGLPWGTKAEKEIPSDIVLATEFELARQQLQTQTPPLPEPENRRQTNAPVQALEETVVGNGVAPEAGESTVLVPPDFEVDPTTPLPMPWPDPSGLIPDGPQPIPPTERPQSEPVLTHTKLYDATDSRFTERLANDRSVADDRRATQWQAYLSRSEDFIRFCCRLHVKEMLEARGGAEQSDLILRWPIGRYRSQ